MEKEVKGQLGVKVEKERHEFKKLIIDNPNYFGTCPELPLKPVLPMKLNTKYEELRCIGFYPETNLLEAIVDIKLPYGYKGNLCSPSSYEYVRFFIDWDGDGDFSEPEEDVGIASVNVHDIPNEPKICVENTKPLSYALAVKLDPKKRPCTTPNLVKVRAILSWDKPPTPGDPDFPPVWGNVVEKWIQIKPGPFWLKDLITDASLKELKIDPGILDLDLPVMKDKSLSTDDLKKEYAGKNVPEHRINADKVIKIAQSVKQSPHLMAKYLVDPKYGAIIKAVKAVLQGKANTEYEELSCVGLQYDQDTFVATLTIKKAYGYNGGLCTKGSHEYVAFWAYLYDQIEQLCYWKYMGTTNVNVHDIPTIPKEGLQYAVYLPADLSSLRSLCTKPKILKLRAILSWQSAPPMKDPNFLPLWGNRVETQVQVKPGSSVQPGEQKPCIWAVGGMPVENISGNAYTLIPSIIGPGYANGTSVDGGFSAAESPFGAEIMISGTITHPPNNPDEVHKLLYRVEYKKFPGGTWHDIDNKFTIYRRIDGVPSGPLDQEAVGGYYKFQKDLEPPVQIEVQDDVLAQWHTPVAEGDGLYEIRLLLYKPGSAPEPGVPADHVASNSVKVVIDNTRPDAMISLDLGGCHEFTVGDNEIPGKFTANDKHIWKYTISILPTIPTVASPPTVDMPAEIYPDPDLPRINVPFHVITTKETSHCGYVVYLYVWDRTIINNYMQGNQNNASVGFCLLE